MSSKWGNIPAWSYDSAVALLQSLKVVDEGTYWHCFRVGERSRRLAKDLGLNEYEQSCAHFAGLLHDIGKIGVPTSIINKPARLDDDEMALMKKHPELSDLILQPFAKQDFFKDFMPAVRGHHERVDGTGYPDKMRGDDIPVLARVILVVDTYDAMAETRAYRKGLPIEVVIAEIQKFSGTQFDSQIAKTFIESLKHQDPLEVQPELKSHLFKKVS